ncbi:sensor histidine kinase [Paenibacillus puldeungensis]|uniref:histidine kinase n=1 Tax=Paenibacillus puldeungensis TaxID=696536 RepID=A0ABW3S4C1_9BACL
MSLKQPFIRILAVLSVCVLVGAALGLTASMVMARQEYRATAELIGAAYNMAPSSEDTFMRALKAASTEHYASGDRILQQYNYSPGTFRSKNTYTMVGVGMLLMFIPGAAAYVLWFYRDKKRRSRLQGLTAYLEGINHGRDTLLMRREDEFSRLEDELYKTVTELRQTKENAIRERKSLADNLADISHQLKTPITSMSLMTELLSDTRMGEDAKYVDNLSRQLRRLETLVSSLLKLSRLDAGTLELKREPVNVYAMFLRAAEPLEDTLRQKHLQLVMASEEEVFFTGDLAWTAEALMNLIKNCSEHTPEGGRITLVYSQNPLYTEIIVEDTGEGFRKEELPHLFKRFYKGKNASKDSVGIGLAIAQSIIRQQNGSIRADNAPGGGARFTVKFYF